MFRTFRSWKRSLSESGNRRKFGKNGKLLLRESCKCSSIMAVLRDAASGHAFGHSRHVSEMWSLRTQRTQSSLLCRNFVLRISKLNDVFNLRIIFFYWLRLKKEETVKNLRSPRRYQESTLNWKNTKRFVL